MRSLFLLGLGLVLVLAGCTAVTPPAGDEDAPRVAFYGDSYTLGTGASDPSLRWSSIIWPASGIAGWDSSAAGSARTPAPDGVSRA